MHRLLKAQLKKAYGKDFHIEDTSAEFQDFIELLNQSYDDFYVERQMLENTLETNSRELNLANEELKKNHELLHSVTESMEESIIYKDLNYRYIGCNRHFTKFTGLSTEEIIGKDDYEIFDQTLAKHFRSVDTKLLLEGSVQSVKEWVKDSKGNDIYYFTVKSPLLDRTGKTIGIVGVSRDITKQYEMEKELEARQMILIQQGRLASMGEMIGNIAHQWRQPLNAIGLIVQKIGFNHSRGKLNTQNINESIAKGMELIEGMSNTIDDFRDFFNPNKTKEHFLLSSAISKAYLIVEPALISHGIDYLLQMDDELEIDGYKNEFSQVIINLLNNAKDILLEKNTSPAIIRVHVNKDKENIYVSVSDNGEGIPASVFPKIFDPYFSTKEEGKGVGIGLYMSKMIVEDHMKGKLIASNTDTGACFTIEIPLSSPAETI